MSGQVHFWTLHDAPDNWDPDLQPHRFLTGYGHSFLELYARLAERGASVTLGRHPPAGTRVLVASLEELTRWRDRISPGPATRLALAAARCPRVLLIHGDLPLSIVAPRYVGLEVMPTRASVTEPARQIVMPVLPQRGMIRRDEHRGAEIRCVALKAYRHNLPEFVLGRDFPARLGAMGIELRIDTEADVPSRWHDFSEVDVALCIRRFAGGWDEDERYARKPATKLINAWCAGVVPVVAPEAAYLELINPGQDAIVADGPGSILSALEELRERPDHVRRLLDNGARRAAAFTVDSVLDEWQRLFSSDQLAAARRISAVGSAVAHAPLIVGDRLRGDGRR